MIIYNYLYYLLWFLYIYLYIRVFVIYLSKFVYQILINKMKNYFCGVLSKSSDIQHKF